MEKSDIIVIGAGPGGYVAAIRGAQLGLKILLIEERPSLGGTCLNEGCIPAKALLDATEKFIHYQQKGPEMGLLFEQSRIDLSQLMSHKNNIVSKLTRGVDSLIQQNNIKVIHGRARFINDHDIEILQDGKEKERVTGKNIILATGSLPVELPSLPFDHQRILDSSDLLSLDKVPQSLLVVGAGAIGLEMASVWKRLGAEVTVVELFDQILPGIDAQISRGLLQMLKKQGIDFFLSTRITDFHKDRAFIKVTGANSTDQKAEGNTIEIKAEKVLVAAGRRANTSFLNLSKAGLQTLKNGKIEVNEKWQTAQGYIYAIGDLIHGPMLAHKAEEEGIAVAEVIAGKPGHVNYDLIPSVVYTSPEVAVCGKNEEQLGAEEIPYNKGIFHFRANGRALALGEPDGFVKILSDKKTDRVLGAHIIGPWASALISEITTVMEFGGSSEDIARTIHPHPTLSEVVKEAAMDVENWSIHLPPKKR